MPLTFINDSHAWKAKDEAILRVSIRTSNIVVIRILKTASIVQVGFTKNEQLMLIFPQGHWWSLNSDFLQRKQRERKKDEEENNLGKKIFLFCLLTFEKSKHYDDVIPAFSQVLQTFTLNNVSETQPQSGT